MVNKIVITLFAALVTGAASAQRVGLTATTVTGRGWTAGEVGTAETEAVETAGTGSTRGAASAGASAPAGVAAGMPGMEMTQGASVPQAKLTRRQKYDRGLAFDTKTPSMPKGLWVAGVNVSWAQQTTADYRFLIIKDTNLEGMTFNISPMVQYVFANNQSIGVRFAYRRHLLDIQNMSFNFSPELNNMLFPDGSLHYKYEDHTYMGFVAYRYYVALGANKRFIIFNEVQAGLGGGQQRELNGWTADRNPDKYKTGTYQTSFNFRLGLAPGATFFVTNVLAVEIQMGILGYEFKKVTQSGTDLVSASRRSSNISSHFDFLSIAFGTTFYL